MNVDVQNMNAPELPRQEDLASLRLLEEIERKPGVSQREISRSLGVSLGLTNLLIRRMASKAWIKVTSIPGRRVLYALTPKGLAEKFRKTRDFVRLSFRYYGDLKQSITERVRGCGRAHPAVAVFGAADLEPIVREAVEAAGGRFAGALEAADRPLDSGGLRLPPLRTSPRFDVLLLLARPARPQREAWGRPGAVLIELY